MEISFYVHRAQCSTYRVRLCSVRSLIYFSRYITTTTTVNNNSIFVINSYNSVLGMRSHNVPTIVWLLPEYFLNFQLYVDICNLAILYLVHAVWVPWIWSLAYESFFHIQKLWKEKIVLLCRNRSRIWEVTYFNKFFFLETTANLFYFT